MENKTEDQTAMFEKETAQCIAAYASDAAWKQGTHAVAAAPFKWI